MDGNAIVTCLKFVELNLKLLMLMQASAMDQHVSGPHLADPLAYWFQQHFLALDATGMLGLPYACSAESGLLPKVIDKPQPLPAPSDIPEAFGQALRLEGKTVL